jgi:general L-amino acid transport system substrate-binding protein
MRIGPPAVVWRLKLKISILLVRRWRKKYMPKFLLRFSLLLAFACMCSAALAQQPTPTYPLGPTLNSVTSRGQVVCGVNQELPGFGYLDPNSGSLKGFDIDFCRALAAAIFGDAKAVQLPTYSLSDGLKALQNGEIDVLIHNVSRTMSQDAAPGVEFGATTFYSGQTMLVRADSGINDWPDLNGKGICLVDKSLAQTMLPHTMANKGLTYQAVVTPTLRDAAQTLSRGGCDAVSGDLVDLHLMRRQADPAAPLKVWDSINLLYTRDPLAPVIRAGDDQWSNIVSWTIYGLIDAEALGINTQTLTTLQRQKDETNDAYVQRVGPEVANMLDFTIGISDRLNLPRTFMNDVIREVGNYGEIYDRNLGENGDIQVPRTINRLWLDGGLIFAPDWR